MVERQKLLEVGSRVGLHKQGMRLAALGVSFWRLAGLAPCLLAFQCCLKISATESKKF